MINFQELIPEAYYPKLSSQLAGRAWPSRPSGLQLQDVNRPDQDLSFDVSDLERFMSRILNDVDQKRIRLANDQKQDINNDSGINILGNIIESSVLTPNSNYYGNLHNLVHLAIGFIHDPENKYLVNNNRSIFFFWNWNFIWNEIFFV